MTAQITIGHSSFSAFKPYFRSVEQQFESTGENTSSSIAESEATDDRRTNVTVARRRQRTTFTPVQADTLEKEYLRDQYMPRSRRILIAKSLSLNESQVKTWFQNRRAKDKRNDKNTTIHR